MKIIIKYVPHTFMELSLYEFWRIPEFIIHLIGNRGTKLEIIKRIKNIRVTIGRSFFANEVNFVDSLSYKKIMELSRKYLRKFDE